MRTNLLCGARYLFLIFTLNVTLSVTVRAEVVRFVQITDPHLFDRGREATENRAALVAAIKKINERIDEQADYKFAVITGDIGVENLVSEVKGTTVGRILEADKVKRERKIEEGAAQLASILAPSRIRVWLFLPGNNDLFQEDPDTQFYRLFIRKLKEKLPGLEVIDLCPEEPEEDKHQLGLYKVGGLAFIGFNNASFKNDNSPGRVLKNRHKQLAYVQQVVSRVGFKDVSSAYLFYHIPELDDPNLVLNSDPELLDNRKAYANNPYPYSSWFVDKSVFDLWNDQVVKNPKVRGLFAGHYHDWRRDTYISYHWLHTVDFLSGSLSKLYICPPLAIKRQSGEPSEARGVQEVTIDGTGRVGVKVFWFNGADRSFASR